MSSPTILDALPNHVIQHILDLASAHPSYSSPTPLQSLAQLSTTCKSFHQLVNATPSIRHKIKEQALSHTHLLQTLLSHDHRLVTFEGHTDLVIKLTHAPHLELIQRYRFDPVSNRYNLVGLTGRLTLTHPTQPNPHITLIYPDELDATVTQRDDLTILAPSRIKDENLTSLFTYLHQLASLTTRHHSVLNLPTLADPTTFLTEYTTAFLHWKHRNSRRVYYKNGFLPQTFKSTPYRFNNQRVFTNKQGATFIKEHHHQPFSHLSRFSRVTLCSSV